jgi:hypothetical protein
MYSPNPPPFTVSNEILLLSILNASFVLGAPNIMPVL